MKRTFRVSLIGRSYLDDDGPAANIRKGVTRELWRDDLKKRPSTERIIEIARQELPVAVRQSATENGGVAREVDAFSTSLLDKVGLQTRRVPLTDRFGWTTLEVVNMATIATFGLPVNDQPIAEVDQVL